MDPGQIQGSKHTKRALEEDELRPTLRLGAMSFCWVGVVVQLYIVGGKFHLGKLVMNCEDRMFHRTKQIKLRRAKDMPTAPEGCQHRLILWVKVEGLDLGLRFRVEV